LNYNVMWEIPTRVVIMNVCYLFESG